MTVQKMSFNNWLTTELPMSVFCPLQRHTGLLPREREFGPHILFIYLFLFLIGG